MRRNQAWSAPAPDLILCLFHLLYIFLQYFLILSSYISFYFAYFPLFPNYGEAKLIHN